MNFAGRLVAGVLMVIVVTITTLVLTGEVALRADLEGEIRAGLEREALLAAKALPADSLQWQDVVEQLAQSTGLRFTVIDSSGRVRAESSEARDAIPSLENHANRPEVRAALGGAIGSDRRTSATVGRPLLYVAVPGGPGVVRVASPLVQADQIIHRAQRSILGAAGLALAFGAILALLAGSSIARPLTIITQAARAIAEGATPRFPRSGIPDIDGLVRALRDMHDQLDQRFADLRQERAESAALVEAMVEGVVAADDRGRIVTANGAARRLLGYEPQDSLPALDQLFRAKAAREVVDALLAGHSVPQRELDLAGQSVLLSGRALPQGGALLVLHDVTELRRLEMVRRDFVANVSHELRTPLTSISGYVETLLDHEASLSPIAREFLTTIHKNATRMNRLTEDLLVMARVESSAQELHPVSIPADLLVHDAVQAMSGLVQDADAVLEIGETTTSHVFADADAVVQVLSNLIENGIKYGTSRTEDHARVVVSARPVTEPSEGVEFRVRDFGAGIASEHLERIFERFYRVDKARSRESGGTGLGLSIARHMVQVLGGTMHAESELNAGSTFVFTLPKAQSPVI
jgi:two-component system, OmpR family, phosphate regulon sensor histidine kinase PhoR